jgi:hypothetical protein
MSTAQSWKAIGLEILQVHSEECGDGSCGCGCGDIPLVTVKVPDKAAAPQECCEPVCGPETCG